MAQRDVEGVIGRLAADEEFRSAFEADPAGTLDLLVARGVGLSRAEAAALIATDRTLWHRIAEALDPRLQKASLRQDRGGRAMEDGAR